MSKNTNFGSPSRKPPFHTESVSLVAAWLRPLQMSAVPLLLFMLTALCIPPISYGKPYSKQSFEDRSDPRGASESIEMDATDDEMDNRFFNVLQNIHGRIGVLGVIWPPSVWVFDSLKWLWVISSELINVVCRNFWFFNKFFYPKLQSDNQAFQLSLVLGTSIPFGDHTCFDSSTSFCFEKPRSFDRGCSQCNLDSAKIIKILKGIGDEYSETRDNYAKTRRNIVRMKMFEILI